MKKTQLALLASLAALLASTGCGLLRTPAPDPSPATPPVAPEPALTRFYQQRLAWSDCESDHRCATLEVPVDYAAPRQGSIRLALIRRPADGERIGSLVVNPGGPGASGYDYARLGADSFGAPVRDAFDVIGFDPRGVGRSAPVRCLDDTALDRFLALDQSPDTSAETNALQDASRSFATACQRRGGGLLAHLSTRDIARDLDVLRAVLGEERLNYLGKSWGTFLGTAYAELFPNRVGRLVLDGALDPTVSADDTGVIQARGFERALAGFLADCTASAGCPLGRDPRAALTRLDQLLADLDLSPFPAGDRQLTQTMASYGILTPLYDTAAWPRLRKALSAALRDDGTGLLELADEYFSRNAEGHYTQNVSQAIYAVNCLDRAVSPPDAFPTLKARYQQASPRFGAVALWGSLPCAYWPVRPVDTPHRVNAPGTPPVLVVGTRHDPATPYQWSQSLAGQFPRGVLLTYEGHGHTAYARDNTCVDSAVDTFLTTGRPPAPNTRCTA